MIAIIDYNAGNLTSVKRALDHLGIESSISSDRSFILSADRVIFPGVGHATAAMKNLVESGISTALHQCFLAGKPILGICLGTQIILSSSEEGDTACLGLLNGTCKKLVLTDKALKVPHMGWDSIGIKRKHPVLEGINNDDEFYFVHSYYPYPSNSEYVIATVEYEIEFPVIIGTRNIIATQFHPEKSGRTGLRILSNFASWDGISC